MVIFEEFVYVVQDDEKGGEIARTECRKQEKTSHNVFNNKIDYGALLWKYLLVVKISCV